MQNKIEIDKDCFDFLLYSYFGGDKNPYAAASKRAYRDLCRTLRFHGRSGIEYRKYIDGLLEKRIRCLIDEGCFSQEQYDEKHQGLCQDMIEYYRGKGINFNIGHAQKWINMTMKYLYIYGGVDISGLFCFFHIPVDQYVFKAVKNKLSIRRPCDAWSKINDYAVYIEYQKKIRSELDVAPLRWEFSHWIEEAVRRKKYED